MDTPDPTLAKQIGPYRVVAWVGSSQLGDVYHARLDGEYAHDVIVKVLPYGSDSSAILKRFHSTIHIQELSLNTLTLKQSLTREEPKMVDPIS